MGSVCRLCQHTLPEKEKSWRAATIQTALHKRKESFLEQRIVRYGLYGLLVAFIITALIGLYKTLTAMEQEYKKAKTAARA